MKRVQFALQYIVLVHVIPSGLLDPILFVAYLAQLVFHLTIRDTYSTALCINMRKIACYTLGLKAWNLWLEIELYSITQITLS